MRKNSSHLAIRAFAAALGAAVLLGGVMPARADEDDWRRHEWRERREFREHERREWCAYHPYACGYPAPGYAYAPPPVIYAPAPPVYAPPPPVVYAPPGISVFGSFNIR